MSTHEAAAYSRWSPTKGSNYSDLLRTFWYFEKVVADRRWSLTRGLTTWDLNFDVLVQLIADGYFLKATKTDI